MFFIWLIQPYINILHFLTLLNQASCQISMFYDWFMYYMMFCLPITGWEAACWADPWVGWALWASWWGWWRHCCPGKSSASVKSRLLWRNLMKLNILTQNYWHRLIGYKVTLHLTHFYWHINSETWQKPHFPIIRLGSDF